MVTDDDVQRTIEERIKESIQTYGQINQYLIEIYALEIIKKLGISRENAYKIIEEMIERSS